MYSKILIPTDGSERSVEILWSLRPLLRSSSQLTLLRVVPEGATEAESTKATAELAATRALIAAWGLPVETRLEKGDAAEQILTCSRDLGFDLVAMASHGRSGVGRLVRGSVAERVLRRCSVPLLLCTPRSNAIADEGCFPRILVPIDGSGVADRILPEVERVALACGSEVSLLIVQSPLRQPPLKFREPTWWTEEQVEEELAPLNPQRDVLTAKGISVRRRVCYGFPAGEILQASKSFDLIAMTTHGRSGASRWMFGSVAESVFRQAECPLLILRVPSSA